MSRVAICTSLPLSLLGSFIAGASTMILGTYVAQAGMVGLPPPCRIYAAGQVVRRIVLRVQFAYFHTLTLTKLSVLRPPACEVMLCAVPPPSVGLNRNPRSAASSFWLDHINPLSLSSER